MILMLSLRLVLSHASVKKYDVIEFETRGKKKWKQPRRGLSCFPGCVLE